MMVDLRERDWSWERERAENGEAKDEDWRGPSNSTFFFLSLFFNFILITKIIFFKKGQI